MPLLKKSCQAKTKTLIFSSVQLTQKLFQGKKMIRLPGACETVSKEAYLPPEEKVGTKSPFAPHIAKKALSGLSPKNVRSAALASHSWSGGLLDAKKFKEFSRANDFVKFLGDSLHAEAYVNQKLKLLKLVSGTTIFESIDLIELKSSIAQLREDVLNVLKDLELEALNQLEKLSKDQKKPVFFENLFSLSKIYTVIDFANALDDEDQKAFNFLKISEALIQKGHFDKSIEVANKILDLDMSTIALKKISKALIKSGDLKKAETVANKIANDESKENTLTAICDAFIQVGDITQAIRIVDALTDKTTKGVALTKVLKALAQSGDADKATELVNLMPDKKDYFLGVVSSALSKNGHITKATEVADTIPDDYFKGYALKSISQAYIRIGDMAQAIKVANTIDDKYEEAKIIALENISEAFVEIRDFDQAISIAKKMPTDRSKRYMLSRISEALAKAVEAERSPKSSSEP